MHKLTNKPILSTIESPAANFLFKLSPYIAMANRFYQPGQERAAGVDALFAAIAPRYDLINDLQSFGLHRRWKCRVLKLAAPQPGQAALDICCGTGDIAFALAAHGANVTGLDFSEAMLAVAERRRAAKSTSVLNCRDALASGTDQEGNLRHHQKSAPENQSVKFLRGDAQQLPFPDSSFDIVTVGYGLRNLASWETGVSEMARVAKPGARIVSLDFGKPDNALWRALYFSYLRVCVPLLGLVFCRNASAYAYILESLKHYPAQRGVADRMRALGLVNVQIHNILGGAMSINYGEKSKTR